MNLLIEGSACFFGLPRPTFPLDAILLTIRNRRLKKGYGISRVHQNTNPNKEMEVPNEGSLTDRRNITQLLLEFSLEKMTSFYDIIDRDFNIHCSRLQLTVTVLLISTSVVNIQKFCIYVIKFSRRLICRAI